MSLAIDIDEVTAVLLADGWHDVAERSFVLDAYEFVYGDDNTVHGGGNSGICPTGFSFLEDLDQNAGAAHKGDKVTVSGPLTAIVAVQETRKGGGGWKKHRSESAPMTR